MSSLAVAHNLYERHQEWALSIAGSALRRIGPRADAEELRQVAQAMTFERALAYDPRRFTTIPVGNNRPEYHGPRCRSRQFELYAYPSVYGACLMSGYRGASGRAKASDGSYIAFSPLDTAREVAGNPGEQAAIEASIDRAAQIGLIVSILHDLPKAARYVIEEHYLTGMSLKSIAESLHTSQSSVSRIHAEALSLLRSAVSSRGLKAWEWL